MAINIWYELKTTTGIILRSDVVTTLRKGLKTERGVMNRLRKVVDHCGGYKGKDIDELVEEGLLKYVMYQYDEENIYSVSATKVLERHGDVKAYFEYAL